MIDIRKVGEAARRTAEEWDVGPIGRDEAIGRAAISTMIPPVDTAGECSSDCPFLTEDLTCRLDWMVVEDKEHQGYTMDAYKPGPNCLAGKV